MLVKLRPGVLHRRWEGLVVPLRACHCRRLGHHSGVDNVDLAVVVAVLRMMRTTSYLLNKNSDDFLVPTSLKTALIDLLIYMKLQYKNVLPDLVEDRSM